LGKHKRALASASLQCFDELATRNLLFIKAKLSSQFAARAECRVELLFQSLPRRFVCQFVSRHIPEGFKDSTPRRENFLQVA